MAIADYTKSIELDPNFSSAYYNRGFAYKLNGKKAKAIADFEEFITLIDNAELILKDQLTADKIRKDLKALRQEYQNEQQNKAKETNC